jgi:ribosomal protein S18 acetylase RimI-like enzyme
LRREDHNELGAIYVLPEYHGFGIGKKLWEQGQTYFDQEKPTIVRLEENNESAKAFYTTLGFQDTDKRFPSGLIFPSGATFNEAEMEIKPVVEKHE